jgi:two-component system, OmpR family, response regulator
MSRRLLLVEDDDAIRTIAQMSLERVGAWTVISAASGEDALNALQADSAFDVVLLDVMMPGLDGPTTLKRLREGPLPPQTPVVFLTAKVGQADREQLLSLGAHGVIAKPFDPMTLPSELDQLLQHTSEHDDG